MSQSFIDDILKTFKMKSIVGVNDDDDDDDDDDVMMMMMI